MPRLCGGKIRAPLLHIRDRGQPRKVSFKERERREPRGRRQGEGVENDNRETLSFREEKMEEGNPSNLSLFHLELRYMLCSVLASLFPDVKPSVPHLQCIYATNVM